MSFGVIENMATTNRERQKQHREAKKAAGGFRVSCWLDKDDGERLRKLAGSITDHHGNKTPCYSDVISLALQSLEIEMAPPGAKNMVRYGLLYLNNEGKNER